MEPDKPKGRGRLLAELKKAAASTEAPPKISGRAALLSRRKLLLEKGRGGPSSAEGEIKTELQPGPSTSTAKEEPEKGSTDSTEKEEQLLEDVKQLSLEEATGTFSFRGNTGNPIETTANYIYLNLKQNQGVFEYEVKFNPDVDSKRNRSKMVNDLLRETGVEKLYDGGHLVLLPSLVFSESKTFQCPLPTNPEETIIVKFIYKKKLRASDPQCVRVYNILFNRIMQTLNYTKMGKSHFNVNDKRQIPQHKLEILPGYIVTVDELEGGLMLCLDTAHRVLRYQTVYEYIREVMMKNHDTFKVMARNEIVDSIVITRYNNKTYRITDIAWDMNPESTFKQRDGKDVAFATYYKNHYNITIQDLKQPLLISKITKNVGEEKVDNNICLVPELTYFTGLTDSMRSNYIVMKDVAEFSRLTPNQRLYNLRQFLKSVKQSEACCKILASWGLSLADDTLNINARYFGKEDIFFGQNFKQSSNDWSRESLRAQCLEAIDIKSWLVISTRKDATCANQFAEQMVKLGRTIGCLISRPRLIQLVDDRSDTYKNALMTNLSGETQVVVLICPNLRGDRYNAIKKMCCVDRPIPSQVILSKNLTNQRKAATIMAKIALQINCKLGGSLWRVHIPASGYMIIGIDAYHGGKGSSSVCGFTASLNSTFTRWFSEAVFQEAELGQFYRNAFKKALENFYNDQGQFPKQIFIYRDGVGDGQLDAVRNFEIPQFKQVLEQMDLKELGFTFIVVQKRINTRIFQLKQGGAENPPAGTIVDHLITRRNYYDFYLVPQTVTQGTVNPTHYIVLEMDSSLRPDIIQRLSYKLCHLYYNWTGTIRVPAPCQYSHKLAAMVGQNIRKIPSPVLSKQLWYL